VWMMVSILFSANRGGESKSVSSAEQRAIEKRNLSLDIRASKRILVTKSEDKTGYTESHGLYYSAAPISQQELASLAPLLSLRLMVPISKKL
jgi:hypothetical protein